MLFYSITLSFYLVKVNTYEQNAQMYIAGDNMGIANTAPDNARTQVLYCSVYHDILWCTSQHNIFCANTRSISILCMQVI